MTPLAGRTVLDLTLNVAGPFCTQILGDLGADVIKVERPGRGDETRAWAPPTWGGESATYLALNRNKRSLALDLKAAEARPILDRLVRRADVLVQSFRPRGAEDLGLGAAAARAANPRLVYCSVTAFGARGPLRDLPGYDPMMQAYAGLMSVTGHPAAPPVRVGTSIVDMGTGMWAAIAILAALAERERTGTGVEITTALFDTALAWIPYQLLGYLASGEVPPPQGSGTAMIVPYSAFPTADGYLLIAAPTDTLFGRLCRALGRPELAADPRFADNPSRVRHRDALLPAVEAETRRIPTAVLLERLRAAEVTCAPIQTLDAVAADPQTKASEMLAPTPHPAIPDLRTVALPLRWDGVRPAPRRPPPRLGEHTREVLRGLGLADGEIEALGDRGVVRLGPA
ncbi:MAG: CoA transferase [Candidatus Rokubacteria bacterium]|nr:CoA transferase [Candidatus Rokubacteria bacterium]